MRLRSAHWFAPSAGRSLVMAALLLLAVVALVALIDLDIARPVDQAIIDVIRAAPLVAPLAWLRAATELGSTAWVAMLAIVVGVAGALARRPFLGAAAAAMIAVAAVANTTLKLVVARPRPDLLPPIVVEPGYAFPSGHTLAATVAYGVIAVLVARSAVPPLARGILVSLLGVVIVVVGLSRVYLGAHYPTDVLGGWLTGLAWMVLFAGLSHRADPRVSEPRAPAPGGRAARADPTAPRSGPPAAG